MGQVCRTRAGRDDVCEVRKKVSAPACVRHDAETGVHCVCRGLCRLGFPLCPYVYRGRRPVVWHGLVQTEEGDINPFFHGGGPVGSVRGAGGRDVFHSHACDAVCGLDVRAVHTHRDGRFCWLAPNAVHGREYPLGGYEQPGACLSVLGVSCFTEHGGDFLVCFWEGARPIQDAPSVAVTAVISGYTPSDFVEIRCRECDITLVSCARHKRCCRQSYDCRDQSCHQGGKHGVSAPAVELRRWAVQVVQCVLRRGYCMRAHGHVVWIGVCLFMHVRVVMRY